MTRFRSEADMTTNTHPAPAAPPELLPCPFCGLDVRDDEGCFPIGNTWEVRCGNPGCFAHEPSDASRAAAIERWNRRRPALSLNGTPGSVAEGGGESTGPVVGGAAIADIAGRLRNLSRIMAGEGGTGRIDTTAWKHAADLAEQLESLAQQPKAEAVAWMTHHDTPMLFPTHAEAASHCDDGEAPIPLYLSPPQPQPSGDTVRVARAIYEGLRRNGMKVLYGTTFEKIVKHALIDSQREGA